MHAIHSDALPSSLRSYAGLLWHSRRGLPDPASMPRIEREVAAVRLDSHWLRAYRSCVGLDLDAADGLPPLALQIAVAPLHLSILADPQFPFKALGLVHLSQRITQTGAIPTAQAVNLRAFTTEAQWARRGMTFGLVTEALVDGQLLWHSETTALAVGASPARGAAGPKQADGPADPRPESPPWREVSSHELPESLGRRYASIAGDLNPIHQHALLARPFGFRRAIIHGTWTLARALAAARLPHGAAYTVDAQFRKPVLLPSGIAVWSRQGPDHDEVKVTDLDGGKVHLTARIGR